MTVGGLTDQEVIAFLMGLFAELFEPAPVNVDEANSALADAESLTIMEILVALEGEFTTFDVDRIPSGVLTVSGLVSAVLLSVDTLEEV